MWFSRLLVEALKPKLPLSLRGLDVFAYFGPSLCCWGPPPWPAAARMTRV